MTAADTTLGAAPVQRVNGGPTPPARTSGSDAAGRRDRGRLVLAEKVIEKIAGQAAMEVPAASGRSGGFLGVGSDADAKARPKVDVTLTREFADIDISVGIAYPGSIRRATQEIRERVTGRVFELTGVRVHRVDIDVSFLTTASDSDRSDHDRRSLR